jgi:hypothetical protein
MRLLECTGGNKFSLTKDFLGDDEIPPYAILSHTWGEGEVTFGELVDGTGESKKGYEKIRFCGTQAAKDGLNYFWVDTCCINKSILVELQDAINSMFRWYQNADECYVYLPDVSAMEPSDFTWEPAFRKSRWFTRGWTLQELLAPRTVIFFSAESKCLGDRKSLKQQISEITTIPLLALQGTPLDKFSTDERLSWIKTRQTTRQEDKAYSLLGIFGIFMSLIYGEGEENAFKRLRKKIEKSLQNPLPQHISDKQKTEYREAIKDLRVTDPSPHKSMVFPFPGSPFIQRILLCSSSRHC